MNYTDNRSSGKYSGGEQRSLKDRGRPDERGRSRNKYMVKILRGAQETVDLEIKIGLIHGTKVKRGVIITESKGIL